MDCCHVDVSPHFIFEESGDSEADRDRAISTEHQASCMDMAALVDDGDAESRTCDSLDDTCAKECEVDRDGGDDNGCDDCDGGPGYNGKDDDRSSHRELMFRRDASGFVPTEEEEEEGVVECMKRVPLNEMEDRIFWETCLAMGHP